MDDIFTVDQIGDIQILGISSLDPDLYEDIIDDAVNCINHVRARGSALRMSLTETAASLNDHSWTFQNIWVSDGGLVFHYVPRRIPGNNLMCCFQVLRAPDGGIIVGMAMRPVDRLVRPNAPPLDLR